MQTESPSLMAVLQAPLSQMTPEDRAPKPVMRIESMNQLHEPVIAFELYNPAPEAVEVGYDGLTFRFPSCVDVWMGRHPTTQKRYKHDKPGVCPIWPLPGRGITAEEIVRHMLGLDGRSGKVGARGIRPLMGTEAEKIAWIQEGRAVYMDFEGLNNERVIGEWEAKQEQRKLLGEAPAPMTPNIRASYQKRKKFGAVAGVKVRCDFCGEGFADEFFKQTHVLDFHQNRLDACAVARMYLLDKTAPKDVVEGPIDLPDMAALERQRLQNRLEGEALIDAGVALSQAMPSFAMEELMSAKERLAAAPTSEDLTKEAEKLIAAQRGSEKDELPPPPVYGSRATKRR